MVGNEGSREPFFLTLKNTTLNEKVEKYISSFVQHIASILEKNDEKKYVSFIRERNGILLFGFATSTIQVIYKFLSKLDQEKQNLHFEVNLVLVESHKMTSGFQF
jgi:phage-related tail protein